MDFQFATTSDLEKMLGQINQELCKRVDSVKAKEKQVANKEASEYLLPVARSLYNLCNDFRLKHVPHSSGPFGQLGFCTEPFVIDNVVDTIKLSEQMMEEVRKYFS